jgi:hypothetical protein
VILRELLRHIAGQGKQGLLCAGELCLVNT